MAAGTRTALCMPTPRHPLAFNRSTVMSHALTRRGVRLTFKHDVSNAQIGKALEEIYRLTGCLTCGIRGIDLILHGGDPEVDALAKLQGVAHAGFEAV